MKLVTLLALTALLAPLASFAGEEDSLTPICGPTYESGVFRLPTDARQDESAVSGQPGSAEWIRGIEIELSTEGGMATASRIQIYPGRLHSKIEFTRGTSGRLVADQKTICSLPLDFQVPALHELPLPKEWTVATNGSAFQEFGEFLFKIHPSGPITWITATYSFTANHVYPVDGSAFALLRAHWDSVSGYRTSATQREILVEKNLIHDGVPLRIRVRASLLDSAVFTR